MNLGTLGPALLFSLLLVGCDRERPDPAGGAAHPPESGGHSVTKRNPGNSGSGPSAEEPAGKAQTPRELYDEIVHQTGEEDLEAAFERAVEAYGPDRWREMLGFIALLPPGEKSNAAVSTALYRVSVENPEVWLTHREDLAALLDDTRMWAVAFNFGQSIARTPMLEAALRDAVSASNTSPALVRNLFAHGLFVKLDAAGVAIALDYLPDLPESDQIPVIESNADTLGPGLLAADGGKRLMGSASDGHRPEVAGLLGKLYAGHGTLDSGHEAVAERLAGPQARQFLTGYFAEVGSDDLGVALSRLGSIRNPAYKDAIIFTMFPGIADSDPEAALLWANEVSDAAMREGLIRLIQLREEAE